MNAKRSAQAGFTIVELLSVIGIMGMLIGLISGGILFAARNARDRRDRVERLGLESALNTFRHTYGEWPVLESEVTNRGEISGIGTGPNCSEQCYHQGSCQSNPPRSGCRPTMVLRWEQDNYLVLNRLLINGQRQLFGARSREIEFLERGRFLAVSPDGERMSWGDCTDVNCPLVNSRGNPYRVTINLDADTVTVESP